MNGAKPSGHAGVTKGRMLNPVLVLMAALIVAGCSASASRLDMSNLLGTKKQNNDRLTTASLPPPVPSEPVYDVEERRQARATPTPTATRRVYQRPRGPIARAPLPEPETARAPVPPKEHRITIRRGDTLYSLARRYNVSVADIKMANGMRSSRLRAGHSLIIPSGYTPATYTVRRGDSIYSIARRHGVSHRQLASYNRLSRPDRIRPGQELMIPGKTEIAVPRQVASVRPSRVPMPTVSPVRGRQPHVVRTQRIPIARAETPRPKAVRIASADPNVRVPARRTTTAPLGSATPPAKPKEPVRKITSLPQPAPMVGTKFRWPVRGRVISKFGSRPNGKTNDGINVAVPHGTSVKAAENGVVAYAGNELKGYGNLVLIRHADNWVTAYAHNDTLKVKRGDKVRRGQIIAKAGRTGNVTKPQLHFELRKGSKPVDPLKYMAAL